MQTVKEQGAEKKRATLFATKSCLHWHYRVLAIQPSPPHSVYLLPEQNTAVSPQTAARSPVVFVEAAVRILCHGSPREQGSLHHRIQGSVVGQVMLRQHPGVTAICGAEQGDVCAPRISLSSAVWEGAEVLWEHCLQHAGLGSEGLQQVRG